MTDNMNRWNAMKRPPTTALKQIKGGRLSGMSNISPQWRWMVMTEQFGMIGFGWRYTVEKIWTSPGANDEHFAFASVNLYIKEGDQWSEAIPGEGGSMLVSKESRGYHNNDEAFKMAVTDALGTAMAKLGVGADIYLGTFDGSKYNEPTEFKKSANTPKEAEKVAGEMKQTAEELKSGDKLSASDLRKSQNFDAIKLGLKEHSLTADNAIISQAIGEATKKYGEASIQDVVSFIVENGEKE